MNEITTIAIADPSNIFPQNQFNLLPTGPFPFIKGQKKEHKIKILKARTTKFRFNIFPRAILFLIRPFEFFFSKSKEGNQIPKSKYSTSKKFDKNARKLEIFIKILMMVKKAIQTLKDRTKYRPLRNFYEKEKEILDDPSYFIAKNKRNRFSFIRIKLIRVFKAKIKSFIRKLFGDQLKIISIIKLIKV